MYGLGFFSFNIIGLSSPLLPCRPVDLRRGLLYSKNLQHPPLALFRLNRALFRLHFCTQFTFPSLGALVKANIFIRVTSAVAPENNLSDICTNRYNTQSPQPSREWKIGEMR